MAHSSLWAVTFHLSLRPQQAQRVKLHILGGSGVGCGAEGVTLQSGPCAVSGLPPRALLTSQAWENNPGFSVKKFPFKSENVIKLLTPGGGDSGSSV